MSSRRKHWIKVERSNTWLLLQHSVRKKKNTTHKPIFLYLLDSCHQCGILEGGSASGWRYNVWTSQSDCSQRRWRGYHSFGPCSIVSATIHTEADLVKEPLKTDRPPTSTVNHVSHHRVRRNKVLVDRLQGLGLPTAAGLVWSGLGGLAGRLR